MITSVECSEPGHALPVANMNPFSENQSNCLDKNTHSMEPPQTKKQTIKNQKQKGASEHRLGSAKHIRIRENEPRGTKKKGIIQSH